MGGKPQETLEHVIERAGTTFSRILSRAKEKGQETIAMVFHGDTLSALDWSLRHATLPNGYREMERAFYLQKGEAWKYIFDENLRFIGEGGLIAPDAVGESFENFRGPSKRLYNT